MPSGDSAVCCRRSPTAPFAPFRLRVPLLTPPQSRPSLPRTRAPHRMPNLSGGSATPSSQSTVREFVDRSGKLWSAVLQDGALIFTAIDATRGGTRAITVDLTTLDDSVSDDALRAWLTDAPRIGTLS
jgi:hypothetical protein